MQFSTVCFFTIYTTSNVIGRCGAVGCTDPPVSVTSYLHIAGKATIHPRGRQALVKESGTRSCDCRVPLSLSDFLYK